MVGIPKWTAKLIVSVALIRLHILFISNAPINKHVAKKVKLIFSYINS